MLLLIAGSLQVLVEPLRVTLEPVPLVTRRRKRVVLPWVNDELRIYAQASEHLIHLFTAGDRDVEILFSTEKQCRRLDTICMKKRIRDLDPHVLRFPWRADFVVVLPRVLIEAVH